MPTIFGIESGAFLVSTEAALVNYADMNQAKKGQALVSQLSPLPGQQDIKVNATLPQKTTWRIMMISDKIGDHISSNIFTNLYEPPK